MSDYGEIYQRWQARHPGGSQAEYLIWLDEANRAFKRAVSLVGCTQEQRIAAFKVWLGESDFYSRSFASAARSGAVRRTHDRYRNMGRRRRG